MSKLTPKQERFVKEYIVDSNGAQAAIRSGYSPKTAKEQASRLLTNVHVQKAVEKAQKGVQKRVEWSAEQILRGIMEIAESKEEATRDRLKAYELGGKHFGMFTDKVEANVTGAMTVVFDKSMEDDEE